jgi:hypothetical protein
LAEKKTRVRDHFKTLGNCFYDGRAVVLHRFIEDEHAQGHVDSPHSAYFQAWSDVLAPEKPRSLLKHIHVHEHKRKHGHGWRKIEAQQGAQGSS